MIELSIIVPVYKVEKYLERCIKSILNQKYQNFELILVDDGSPDNCGEICDKYEAIDHRVKVLHKKNGGLSSARNAGLEVARGKFVGFVDSDDWITEDMYEYLISLIKKYDCDIASASYTFTKGESTFKQDKIKETVYIGKESLKQYMKIGMSSRIGDYPVWTKIYKRDLFKHIKFPLNQLYEDGVTNYLLLQQSKKYVKSNKIVYYYFQDGSSITRSKFREKDLDLLVVGKQFFELATKQNDKELIKLAKTKEARSYFSLLTKIAIYGVSPEVKNQEEILDSLIYQLKRNYFLLLFSKMPFNRKILMTLILIDRKLITNAYNLYTKFKKDGLYV